MSFVQKVNDFRLFCGDSIILWPNFGSNVINVFCERPILDIMDNICERTQSNLWGLYR